MTSKMTEEELNGNLKKFGLSRTEACRLVWLKTRATLNPSNMQNHIQRYGALSAPYTAALRLFFKDLEREHERI